MKTKHYISLGPILNKIAEQLDQMSKSMRETNEKIRENLLRIKQIK